MGSKSRIAKRLCACLPPAEHFYDLFCGGGAVTHAAMLSRKWRCFHLNDLHDGLAALFKQAMYDDVFVNDRRWISREDFFALKEKDLFVRLCYSFGNDGRTYLYGRDKEPYKQAFHNIVALDDGALLAELCPNECDEVIANVRRHPLKDLRQRRFAARNALQKLVIANPMLRDANPLYRSITGYRVGDIRLLQNLEQAERFFGVRELHNVVKENNVFSTDFDYQDVEILQNSVVYCDIPYNNTHKYACDFDHERFYKWCLDADFPVFVSEYQMPDGFTCIAEWTRQNTMSASANIYATERLFIQNKFASSYKIGLF